MIFEGHIFEKDKDEPHLVPHVYGMILICWERERERERKRKRERESVCGRERESERERERDAAEV